MKNENEINVFSFCIVFDLDKNLTFKNENKFSFYSLNRIFVLTLQAKFVQKSSQNSTWNNPGTSSIMMPRNSTCRAAVSMVAPCSQACTSIRDKKCSSPNNKTILKLNKCQQKNEEVQERPHY